MTKALLKCQLMVPRHPADEQGKKEREKRTERYLPFISRGRRAQAYIYPVKNKTTLLFPTPS